MFECVRDRGVSAAIKWFVFCLYVVCTSVAAASNRCVRRIWAREYMMLSELHQRRALRENRRPISVGFLLCDGGALGICSTAVNRVGGQR
jgi:hypothetical protein